MNGVAAGLLALAVVLVAQGCLSVNVEVEAEPGADFTSFRKFAHAPRDPAEPSPGQSRRVRSVVREQIEKELVAQGFELVPLERADKVVAFRARGVNRARWKHAGDPDANFYRVQNYVEGTLVIDIFDVGRSKPVWHGVGTVDIFSDRDTEEAARRAVKAILAEFPPDRAR